MNNKEINKKIADLKGLKCSDKEPLVTNADFMFQKNWSDDII